MVQILFLSFLSFLNLVESKFIFDFRKLVMFDEWSNFAVHVAMDNTVVIEDISTLFYFMLFREQFCEFGTDIRSSEHRLAGFKTRQKLSFMR